MALNPNQGTSFYVLHTSIIRPLYVFFYFLSQTIYWLERRSGFTFGRSHLTFFSLIDSYILRRLNQFIEELSLDHHFNVLYWVRLFKLRHNPNTSSSPKQMIHPLKHNPSSYKIVEMEPIYPLKYEKFISTYLQNCGELEFWAVYL